MQEETKTQEDITGIKAEGGIYYLHEAAKVICPPGMQHEGSFCVHVYRHGLIKHNDIAFVVSFAGNLEEPLAIEAAKILKERLMARYGHKPPRKLR